MRLAVIGGGVSGLGAAYVLSRVHEVHLYEREPWAGGHVRTVLHGGHALDTGFVVSNAPNYPLLSRLFDELGVATQASSMSFSVSCRRCGLEYAGSRPFAQPRNALDPGFAGLLREIVRWLRTARSSIEGGAWESASLARYLDEHGYSTRFRRHFLVPLTSALWSAAPGAALEIPAAYAIRFFDNHGMLGFVRHRWQTVVGGAQAYVQAVLRHVGFVSLGVPVRGIRRETDGVLVRRDDGLLRRYDGVVVATHADEALRLLEDPSDEERALLGTFPYTRNEAVLHTDVSFLPRARAARASWNYRLGTDDRPTITYSLNRLQRLAADTEYLVTLNEPVPDEHVLDRVIYTHPRFTVEAIAAQRRLGELSGPRRTAFAGAYHGNGFHEDGLASGVRAAETFGVSW